MYLSSIFNDVLGPIMYGPSSSHSAAPCIIGNVCQMLLGAPVKKALIGFDPTGSFAVTYKLHCSDRGFTAGLLGIRVDDAQNLRAFEIAKEKGVDISFEIKDQVNKHPNYCHFDMYSDDDHLEIGTISTGGGRFEIVTLDGFPIMVTGDDWEYFVKNPAYIPDYDCEVVEKGADKLLIVRRFTAETPSLPEGEWVRSCEPILPVNAKAEYDMPFITYKEAVAYGEERGLSAGELGILYEMARSGKSREEVIDMMKYVMRVMHNAVNDSVHRDGGKAFGYYPYKARTVSENIQKLPPALQQIAKISINASAVFEHTLSVGLVVAAPTGGSCGVIPSTIVELGMDMGISEEKILEGLFAAGLVGIFITQDATFGCEVAGCQAENGSGSSMAAAGIASMLGASMKEAFDAAAIALQNTLGLICDPVAGAYVPCVTRNAMAATNAVSAATMVMSGYVVYVPLDETIKTMMDVGRIMPACHRCTGGGLNLTETGKRLNEINEEYINSL